MSLRYKLAAGALKMFGYKEMFQMPRQELLEKIEIYNRSRKYKLPSAGKNFTAERMIEGKYPCVVIRKSAKNRADKAILFLVGGEYMLGPDKSDIEMASAFVTETGSDLWLPYYPLVPEHSIRETYNMILNTYAQMLKVYSPENISVLGLASGAALGLGLVPHIHALRKEDEIPAPAQIIACSPTCIPADAQQREQMRAMADEDVMIDANFLCDRLENYLEAEEYDIPAYMKNPAAADFTGQPPLHFYFGQKEVLSVLAESFEQACRAAGTPYTMKIEKDMCHTYPTITFFPEGKNAHKEIVKRLRES